MSEIEKSAALEGNIVDDANLSAEDWEIIERQSLGTILWQAGDKCDAEGNGIQTWDSLYDSDDDATQETREWAVAAMQAFVAANIKDVRKYLEVRTASDLAHDYWLTRNHHGAGFWDRGLGALGDRLTEACQNDGDYYVFDDYITEKAEEWRGKWHAE